MSSRKDHEMMMKLDKCYDIVLQSSAQGISVDEVAKKLGRHRTTVYGYLNSLELMGKIGNERGIWRVKTEEQTTRPAEKEIEIELPIPKDQLLVVVQLELLAKEAERVKFFNLAGTYRTLLETLRDTRTIKIKGKNVDNLDLEKLGALIQQANAKASKVNLKGLLKSLRRYHARSS